MKKLSHFFAALDVLRPPLVLCYHGLLSDRDAVNFKGDHLYLSETTFIRHLDFFEEHFNFVTLREVEECLLYGKRLPSRSISLTFDDAFASVYFIAAPILRKRRIPFSIFVPTQVVEEGDTLWPLKLKMRCLYDGLQRFESMLAESFVRKSIDEIEAIRKISLPSSLSEHPAYQLMNWHQIRQLSRDKLVTLGSHGRYHVPASWMNEEDLHTDFTDSKRLIFERTGVDVRYFAYPNGESQDIPQDKSTLQCTLNQSGYSLAFATRLDAGFVKPWAVPRISMNANIGLSTLPIRFLRYWQSLGNHLLETNAEGKKKRVI